MKKLFVLLFLLFSNQIFGAVTYATAITTTGESSSFTVGQSVTGSNKLMLVCVSLISNNGQYVNSMTYDGNAMTFLAGVQLEQKIRTEVWYYIAPANGNKDVVVSLSGTAKTAVNTVLLTGVNQITPFYYSSSHTGKYTNILNIILNQETGNSIFLIATTDSNTTLSIAGPAVKWNYTYDNLNMKALSANSVSSTATTIPPSFSQRPDWATIILSIKVP
jgi:hypothetical protein